MLIMLFISILTLPIMAQTDNPEGAGFTLPVIATVIAGVYEVLTRVVKTTKTWSIIGNIINALKWISDSLDHGKKTEK